MKKQKNPASKFTPPRIGIVALSSVIPKIEFETGVDALRFDGWHVEVHPEVSGQYYFYPASDETRAKSFLQYAYRKDLDAVWCARGGYGITHLLPLLERMTAKRKPSKKTLLGYSDVTALHEFVRKKWGWETIHAPMPSLKTFSTLSVPEKNSYRGFLLDSLKRPHAFAQTKHHLEWISPMRTANTSAPLVGGNLAVWLAMAGTKYFPNAAGKILFFEEIGENVARINRYLHQLEQAGGFKGVKAIVLGDFMDCRDTVPMRIDPFDNERKRMIPLRAAYPDQEALQFVFAELSRRTKIPVAFGIPAGHGPNFHSLYLGKKYTLKKNGEFEIAYKP
ncbi:MAG: LD-carboxypeptidase [Bdellovibrionales bacterium]|nr:LD-carboxypeptidase [Bdellovibrionales bacterium]